MPLTTTQLEEIKSKAAKATQVAKEAREKSASEARKKELKETFLELFNEQLKETRSAGVEGRREQLQYSYDSPGSVENDSLNTMIQKSAKAYGSREEDVKAFHRLNDRLLVAYHNLKYSLNLTSPSQLNAYQEFVKGENELAKALATSRTGYGAEWLVTQFSRSFIEEVESELVLPGLHEIVNIPMGVEKLDLGGGAVSSTAYKISESISDESDKIPTIDHGTRKVTLDPVDIGARELASVQQHEDAALSMSDYIINRLRRAYRAGIEKAIVDGDTAGTQDSDNTLSRDIRRLWNGYRKNTNSGNKIDANDLLNVTTFRKALQGMGNYGKPGETVAITNAVGYWKTVAISEVLTVDKYGTLATILSGEIGRVLGVPIIWSDLVRQDLNESGDYDGLTTDETAVHLVYRDGYVFGLKREAGIETKKDIETQQIVYVVTGRADFKRKYAASETVEALIYDLNTGT